MEPIKIYRTKNGTIITPYRKYQCRDLEYSTSIYDKVYHKSIEMTGFFLPNYKDDQPAFVTTYLPEDYIASNFRNYNLYKVDKTTALEVSRNFNLKKDVHLTEVQGKISNDIIRSRKTYSEWFINLQTGAGKTVLGTYLSSYFKKKTLIICFMRDILEQWKNTYLEKTTIYKDKIKNINSSKFLEKIYYEGCDKDNCDIYLISPSLITSYLNNNPWWMFSEVINNLGIGTVIFDEGHRNMSAMVKVNALTNIEHTIYLSADYAQGDYQKEKLFYSIFKNTLIMKPDEETAKSLKHTKVIVVDYNSKPSVTESTSIYNKYGFSAEYYMDYQINKKKIFYILDTIMEMIEKAREQSNHPEWKTLILLEHVKHVDIIYEHLVEKYRDKSNLIFGRYHSGVSPEDKENTLEFADVIISTYKSFGTGMDINSIKYVISLNQCNKITANQAAGRSRALPDGSDSIYFIVTDSGFKYCKQKTKVVLGYLNEQKLKEPPYVYHL